MTEFSNDGMTTVLTRVERLYRDACGWQSMPAGQPRVAKPVVPFQLGDSGNTELNAVRVKGQKNRWVMAKASLAEKGRVNEARWWTGKSGEDGENAARRGFVSA